MLHGNDNAVMSERVTHLVEDEPAAAHVLHGPYLEMSGGPCGILIRQPACCTFVSTECCVYDKDSTTAYVVAKRQPCTQSMHTRHVTRWRARSSTLWSCRLVLICSDMTMQ